MRFFSYFFLVIALFGFANHSLALTASPTRLELSGDPGGSVAGAFELYNETRKAQSYKLKFANFESKDETGQPTFSDSRDNMVVWAKLQPEITLGPLERRKINFTVDIPRQTEPGGYFAGVLATTVQAEELDEGEVGVESSVGTLVLLRVNGEMQEGADILEFKIKEEKVFRSLPVDFYYRFQNEGDSWVKPLGDIVIKNLFGQTAKIVPANPDGANVLTKSIRRFEASWLTRPDEVQDVKAQRPPPLPNGFWNKVKHEVKYFALGRYSADLTLTYGLDQKHTSSNAAFWVMPWELLFVVIGSLIVVLGTLTAITTWIILKIIRRRQKRFPI